MNEDYHNQIPTPDFIKNMKTIHSSIEENILEVEINFHSLLNAVTNIISFIESHFKYLFLICVDDFKFSIEYLSSVKSSLTFNDLYYVFESKITMGRILSNYYNFQKLEDIQKVFSDLLKTEGLYFAHLQNYFVEVKFVSHIEFKGTLHEYFDDLLKIRHQFIHDYSSIKYSDDLYSKLSHMVESFDFIFFGMAIFEARQIANLSDHDFKDILNKIIGV